MFKTHLGLAVGLLASQLSFAQEQQLGRAFGYVKDEQGKPVERVSIYIKGLNKTLMGDRVGYFQAVDLPAGLYEIIITKDRYEPTVLSFEMKEAEKRHDLGNISLKKINEQADQNLAYLDQDTEGEGQVTQTNLGLLQSSRDIFNRMASYDLGFYWFRPRGLNGTDATVLMNGIPMKRPDQGFIDYNTWGGLNEITRYPEVSVNHNPSEYSFGGLGGIIYKNTKASEYRPGHSFNYSEANRNFRHRLSYRYSTGMGKSGWAITGMLARRWAGEGIQEGTFYESIGGYFGIEKKLNDHHSFHLNLIGTFNQRALSSPNTAEIFNYRGERYNAYWGLQNNTPRAERVRGNFNPILQISHQYHTGKGFRAWSTLSFQRGRDYTSRLDWYNAANPLPIYYRNLPSYWLDRNSIEMFNLLNEAWNSGNKKISQIQWDNLYAQNRNNVETIEGITGRRALYYTSRDVKESQTLGASTHLNWHLKPNLQFFVNLNFTHFKSHQFKEIENLLGADFALNQDFFSHQRGLSGRFDERQSSVIVREGDPIHYNFLYQRTGIEFNPVVRYEIKNVSLMGSAKLGWTHSEREGLFQNFQYRDSYGLGQEHNQFDWGIKGLIRYQARGHHHFIYSGTAFSQVQDLDKLYLNPRISGSLLPDIRNRFVTGHEFSYTTQTPRYRIKASIYYNLTKNDTRVQRFYMEGLNATGRDIQGNTVEASNTFVTQSLVGISYQNTGIELASEMNLTPRWIASGLLSWGDFTYINNPEVYLSTEGVSQFQDGSNFRSLGKAHIAGLHQSTGPQRAYVLGLKYQSPRFWWVGTTWNLLGKQYIEPIYSLYTQNFFHNYASSTPYPNIHPEIVARIQEQQHMPEGYFLNLNAGKSFILGKYYLLLTASVNNLLNNLKYQTGAFQQTRHLSYVSQQEELQRTMPLFSPRYWLLQGRSYFVNVQLRF